MSQKYASTDKCRGVYNNRSWQELCQDLPGSFCTLNSMSGHVIKAAPAWAFPTFYIGFWIVSLQILLPFMILKMWNKTSEIFSSGTNMLTTKKKNKHFSLHFGRAWVLSTCRFLFSPKIIAHTYLTQTHHIHTKSEAKCWLTRAKVQIFSLHLSS